MDVFKSVDMAVTGNVYEGGKVTSRSFWTPEGERKTVGIMLPGSTEYAEVTTKIVIAETVLVGIVPDSYTRVEGDQQDIVGRINDYAGQ